MASPVTMAAPVENTDFKRKIQFLQEQKDAAVAYRECLEVERGIALELAIMKRDDVKRKVEYELAMAQLEQEMASLNSSFPSFSSFPSYRAAIGAAGGGAKWANMSEHHAEDNDEHHAEDNDEERAEDHDEEREYIMVVGLCNKYINGIRHPSGCRFTHPKVNFTEGEYNFPKELKKKKDDGTYDDYMIYGYCKNTLNGRHCYGKHPPSWKHPKGYKNPRSPGNDFRVGYPNWPTA